MIPSLGMQYDRSRVRYEVQALFSSESVVPFVASRKTMHENRCGFQLLR